MIVFQTELHNEIQKILAEQVIVSTDAFVVERPVRSEHGDYSSNVAMMLYAQNRDRFSQPRELATFICHNLEQKKLNYLEKIEVAGLGFINFHISKSSLSDFCAQLVGEKEPLVEQTGEGKSCIVEYSSPNIAKPFTVGHLRSTIIGDAIANMMQYAGYTVHRDNHLGDWGTQFGKLIVAIKEFGDQQENEKRIQQSAEPMKELVALYVAFHTRAEQDASLEEKARQWFTKLEQGDEEARRLWKLCIDYSLVEFQKIYDKLHVTFGLKTSGVREAIGSSIFPESFFEDKMKEVIEELREKRLLTESEGAQLVFFENDAFPPLMILKKDGSTLYSTRDLATDRFRKEKYGKDILIINEVVAEQSLYFQQIFEIEELLGYFPKAQRKHVGHGMFRFKDGKMSTRKGNVIWLEDVITEAINRASVINAESAEAVGIGAIKYNDLKRESEKDVVFDWDELLNLKGNSGPYLQYTLVRARSVLAKLSQSFKPSQSPTLSQSSDFTHPDEENLARALIHISEYFSRAVAHYAPHELCTATFELAQLFNTFYATCPVATESDPTIRSFRTMLVRAVERVITDSFAMLGISAPVRM
ncbi:MAG: arginine--tRNA ligase [Candidatus Pacebacteria bacterium RIFOXYB1_FULL_44_10]|nr:MAG: arginine--tRNA ligase [Candidatus Pacebacteria bacterium RIFOXYB1_FULL_44_10]